MLRRRREEVEEILGDDYDVSFIRICLTFGN